MTNDEGLWRKRFGANLMSLIPKNMSYTEFAKICGIDTSTLNYYISGKRCPSAWTVVKIARCLGRPITDVIDYFY